VTACLANSLGNLTIFVLLGLIIMPLAIGGIDYRLRQAPGVRRGLGCASILLGLFALVLVFVVATVLANPQKPRLYGGWVESRSAGYSVHLASLGDCSSHPAMHFAPGALGPAYPPAADCCSIAWWAEGRSDATEWSAVGPEVLHEPTGGLTVWNDLDGFADYLTGTDGTSDDGFARTEIEAAAGRAIRLDDERTRPSSAYLFTDGARYYSVACSVEDPPDDRWLSIAETFELLPAEG
jgi:hypothetical protein